MNINNGEKVGVVTFVGRNVAVNFHSAVSLFAQVPLPLPTRPGLRNNVMWNHLYSFSSPLELSWCPKIRLFTLWSRTGLLFLRSGRSCGVGRWENRVCAFVVRVL